MDREGNNYYQTCRILTGLTQVEAAELLAISVDHLAKIETNTRIPSDEVVDAMAEIYKAPLLAWWHLKHHNPLGHRLPDVQAPLSSGDMAMQSILMEDDIREANQLIKKLLADGVITQSEIEEYQHYKNLIKLATDRGASIGVYEVGV